MFVLLRISPPTINLAASYFARWFFLVLGRESPILGNFAPQKPKIGRIGHPDVNISIDMRRCKSHARDALFVEYRAVCGHRIGMCGYTTILEDGRTCSTLVSVKFYCRQKSVRTFVCAGQHNTTADEQHVPRTDERLRQTRDEAVCWHRPSDLALAETYARLAATFRYHSSAIELPGGHIYKNRIGHRSRRRRR